MDKGGVETQPESEAPQLDARFRIVFARRPELHRCVIQNKAGLADHIDRASLDGELFITQITLHPRHGAKQYDEVYAEISRAVTQLVAERPEVLPLLPGKAFVRALH
jgi:hypothetical protein